MKKILLALALLFTVSLTSCEEFVDALSEELELRNIGYEYGYADGYTHAACGYLYNDDCSGYGGAVYPSFVSGYKSGYRVGFDAGRGKIIYSPEQPSEMQNAEEESEIPNAEYEMPNELETKNIK